MRSAVPEDPLTQYLLGFALVSSLVGTVGAIAQTLHTGALPSLSYGLTVVVVVVLFLVFASLSDRRADDEGTT